MSRAHGGGQPRAEQGLLGPPLTKMRPLSSLILLLLCLLVTRVELIKLDLESEATQTPMVQRSDGGDEKRPCLVEELLPSSEDGDLSRRWCSANMVVDLPYDCTCPMLKSSYVCPHLGKEGYPTWEPAAVAEGMCEPVSREALAKDPLPPGYKVLAYGNSHLRQMIEGVMCMFQGELRARGVTVVDPGTKIKADVTVKPDFKCRSCYGSKTMRPIMVQYGCIAESDIVPACSCDDNVSVFEFANGSTLHYFFAHTEEDKAVEDALEAHGTDYGDYDAVFANAGNDPRLEPLMMISAASKFGAHGVPFFFQSVYQGEGDIRDLTPEQKRHFDETGAFFIPVSEMVKNLQRFTKGFVEDEWNPHYCLPGPPDEIGLLMLRLVWALAIGGGQGRT